MGYSARGMWPAMKKGLLASYFNNLQIIFASSNKVGGDHNANALQFLRRTGTENISSGDVISW